MTPIEDDDAPPANCEHCDCWHDTVPDLRSQLETADRRITQLHRDCRALMTQRNDADDRHRAAYVLARDRAETAGGRASELTRLVREATEHHCSCGGDGPGQGCNACEIYHHVFATPEPK